MPRFTRPTAETDPLSIYTDGTSSTSASIPFAHGWTSDSDATMTDPNALIKLTGGGDSGLYDIASGAGFYPQNNTSSGSFLDCKNKCKVNVDNVTVMTFQSSNVDFSQPTQFDSTVYTVGRATEQAGSGGAIVGVGGTLAYSVTQIGNTTVGETDLWSYTVPGNTLDTNGDSLSFDMMLFAANTANAKRVRVYWGGTVIGDTTSIGAQNGNCYIRGVLIRLSSTHTYCQAFCHTLTKWSAFATYTDVTATLSNSQIFKVTGTAALANNDVVFRLGKLKWDPVP